MTNRLIVAGLLCFVFAAQVEAAPAKAYNVRMRRTDMPDTTDIPSLINSIITPGMTNEQKAKAVFRVVVQYTHQNPPPREFLGGCTHDTIKMINVYGYRMCCCAAGMVETLVSTPEVGFFTSAATRPRTMNIINHNVPDIYYDGAWHMIDPSLIAYFNKPGGGIASVEELRQDSYSGVFALLNVDQCPFANPAGGWFPASTHNLDNARAGYNSASQFLEAGDGYSNGWSVGHRCLLTLREGETLVRSCAVPAAHHVNEDIDDAPGSINARAGQGLEFQYMNQQIPDQPGTYHYVHPSYHGGIVGNGTLTYTPNLARGGYRGGMEEESNMACTADDSQGPAIHLAATGTGYVIFRMQCPYIFLDGNVSATFKRAGAGVR